MELVKLIYKVKRHICVVLALIAANSFAKDTLGGKVALKNDVAMLGVMLRDDKGQDSGAAFIQDLNSNLVYSER